MTQMSQWLMWACTALTGALVFLGSSSMTLEAATSPEELASVEALEWVEDLGPVNSSEIVYSEDFGHPVWRVRGTTTTVIMDSEYDLLGLEFHD